MQRKKNSVVLAGLDVSARTVAVALERDCNDQREQLDVSNDAVGHRKLVRLLFKRGSQPRVCLEATGVYGLELACALVRAGIAVMVANPRAIANFGSAMFQRS